MAARPLARVLVTLTLICIAAAAIAPAAAAAAREPSEAPPPPQRADPTEKLKPVTRLAGTWKGTATFDRGPAGKAEVQQHEVVQVKLDGAAVLIEGRGTVDDAGQARPVHEALGVIFYDPRSDGLKMLAVTRQSGSVLADVTVDADGAIRWGFNVGPRQFRYKITLDADTWTESGEMSLDDGATWQPFIEMNLKRVGD